MNTPTSKTRALCVATRCTTVEQFVATFHRFCGDDETFFVATMTSRPIGLETPFSIQLADKQPVLRGLCIVLDAWETPENRFKRPGIRLGIKRLTADSQVIYDRLKAASRAPGSGLEGSSGPTPQPQLAAGSQPPGTMRRPATPPPLPPLSPPRTVTPRTITPPAVPAMPAIAKDTAPPLVVRVPPLGGATPTTAPRVSRGSSTGSPPRGVAARGPAATPPALPSVSARTGTTRPGLPSIPPRGGEPRPARPALPSVVPVEAKPGLPSVVPVDAKPAIPGGSGRTGDTRPGMPSAVPSDAKPAAPGAASADAKPAEPGGSGRTGDTRPGMPSAVPSAVPVDATPAAPGAGAADARPAEPEVSVRTGDTKPGMPTTVPPWAPPTAEPAPAAPSRIAVTRFQIALRVDSAPAPLTDVEFKPTELAPRKRFERIIGEPSPSEQSSDDALPAVIIDRMSGPMSGPVPVEPADAEDSDPAAPRFAPFESTNPTVDPLADRRTPGSSLVLPANPLQDLSDESIEGFVDCTLYEETENIFHPGVDGPEWADVTAETPMPAMPRPSPPRPSPPSIAVPVVPTTSTVPAMPYDTPPHLTVRVQDGTESLSVAPDDPALTRAAAGELGAARRAAAAAPEPPRPSSGPLGVPSAEIIDDPPPSPPAVIVDDPALSQAMADELRARPAAADPESHSRTASGELWSETLRRTPADGLPRLQRRPDTPLPRPATNVPMDLGDSPDPASWFDSVSLPHSAAAPRPAMAMEAALAPGADAALAPGDSDPALAMAPQHGVASPPDPAVVSGAALAPGVAVDPSLLAGMPPGMAPPGMAPPGMPGGMPPGMAPPGMPGGMPPGMPGGMPPGMAPPGMLGGMPPEGMPPGMAPGMAPAGFGFAPGPLDPALAGAMPPGYPGYSAADLVALPGMPVARVQPPWQRWLLIAGSAVVAIIIAFVMARMARGSDRAAPPARPAAAAPAPVRAVAAPPVVPAPVAAAAGSATGDPDGAAAGEGDPSDDGAAPASGTQLVGSGPCRFTVATTPAAAAVRFDDQPMGPSPLTIQGSCDKHKVDIAHVRYQSVTRWVTLSADKPQQLEISLPRPVHAVTVTSSPPGAELSIDGRRAGITPTVVQVAGFATVNLTFTKAGYKTVTKKVYSKVAQDGVFVKLTR